MSEPTKLLYSKAEASSLLSISIRGLGYVIANGDIKVVRIGKRVLVSHKELAKYASKDHQYLTRLGA